MDTTPSEKDAAAFLAKVRFRSRWHWFAAMIVVFLVVESIGIYSGFPMFGTSVGSLGVGTIIFGIIWGRAYRESFSIPETSPWHGLDQGPLNMTLNNKALNTWPVLTREQFESLSSFDRLFYRHHNLIFWAGVILCLLAIAWIWRANGLTQAFWSQQ